MNDVTALGVELYCVMFGCWLLVRVMGLCACCNVCSGGVGGCLFARRVNGGCYADGKLIVWRFPAKARVGYGMEGVYECFG